MSEGAGHVKHTKRRNRRGQVRSIILISFQFKDTNGNISYSSNFNTKTGVTIYSS